MCGSCEAHGRKGEAKAAEGTWSCGGKVHATEAKAAMGSGGCCGKSESGQTSAKNVESSEKTKVVKKVEQYIQRDKEAKGGYFLLYDEKVDKPLALTLQGVHKDMVLDAGDGTYVACADFVDTDGKVYDVDILVRDAGDRGLEVSGVSIHKAGDEHRYQWRKTEHGLEKQHAERTADEAKTTGGKS